jgi:hypothetical protein
VYVGRYLYRGVLPEKDIRSDRDGLISFRIRVNSGAVLIQSLPGAEFLWMLLRHVRPKRLRRARDYGLLHGNSQKLLQMVRLLLRVVLPGSLHGGGPVFVSPPDQFSLSPEKLAV